MKAPSRTWEKKKTFKAVCDGGCKILSQPNVKAPTAHLANSQNDDSSDEIMMIMMLMMMLMMIIAEKGKRN